MLQVLGSPKRLCDGITRRDLISVGGLSLLGVGLPTLTAATADAKGADYKSAEANLSGFGSAKNVILLYLFGGPSQLETLDMKPAAPVEIRGQLQAIESSLPGLLVCEYLPNLAKVMDRATVVRSLTHPWNFHGMQYATTGAPEGSVPLEETLTHPMHQPYLGSVVNYYDQLQRGPKPYNSIPDNLVLPFPLSSRRPAARYTPPFASYLGSRFDPIWTEFKGPANPQHRSSIPWTCHRNSRSIPGGRSRLPVPDCRRSGLADRLLDRPSESSEISAGADRKTPSRSGSTVDSIDSRSKARTGVLVTRFDRHSIGVRSGSGTCQSTRCLRYDSVRPIDVTGPTSG